MIKYVARAGVKGEPWQTRSPRFAPQHHLKGAAVATPSPAGDGGKPRTSGTPWALAAQGSPELHFTPSQTTRERANIILYIKPRIIRHTLISEPHTLLLLPGVLFLWIATGLVASVHSGLSYLHGLVFSNCPTHQSSAATTDTISFHHTSFAPSASTVKITYAPTHPVVEHTNVCLLLAFCGV